MIFASHFFWFLSLTSCSERGYILGEVIIVSKGMACPVLRLTTSLLIRPLVWLHPDLTSHKARGCTLHKETQDEHGETRLANTVHIRL
jgi:hypothetical protein